MKKWLYVALVLTKVLNGQIEIEPVGTYGLKKVGRNTYELKLHEGRQTLVRLTGTVQDGGYQKVMWSTKKKYYWSNGYAKDEFKVVNPAAQTKAFDECVLLNPETNLLSITFLLVITPDNGKPEPIPFPQQIKSGLTL